MSSNVGLSTPRGSGTSGYIQFNKAQLHRREERRPESYHDRDSPRNRPRQPNKEILEHDRKREVEVKCLELQDKLEEEGEVDEEEIELRVEALRKKLLKESEEEGTKGRQLRGRNVKSHQVHELAAAKLEETERLRKALGIREDYEEGGHWKRQDEERERRVKEAASTDRDGYRDRDTPRARRRSASPE